MSARIDIDRGKITDFCRRHHIRKLALFGSVLRDDFRPDSDVDVLVEFHPEHVPGFAFFAMQDELSEMLGRKVDLHTPGFLSSHFRDRVLEEAEVYYVAASRRDEPAADARPRGGGPGLSREESDACLQARASRDRTAAAWAGGAPSTYRQSSSARIARLPHDLSEPLRRTSRAYLCSGRRLSAGYKA